MRSDVLDKDYIWRQKGNSAIKLTNFLDWFGVKHLDSLVDLVLNKLFAVLCEVGTISQVELTDDGGYFLLH